MAKKASQSIDSLIQSGEWDAARRKIERELKRTPDDHWLLTQLGVTQYEQGRYRESLPLFMAALEIVPDCPLALWNVAGTLDALGQSESAASIYTWLLKSNKTAADDPCWESAAWTASLKTDCVYRLGACFQRMGRPDSAEHCFRQYINLMLVGMKGTYSVEDAARNIREVSGTGTPRSEREVRDAFKSTLQDTGVKSIKNGNTKLPKFSLPEPLATR